MSDKELVNRSKRRNYYEARSKEELQQNMIQLYESGQSQHEIARELNIPRGTISRWMIEIGLKGREPGEAGKVKSKIYHYDENFFSKIDTPDKAYIIGFINGDGYIVDEGKRKRLGITLAHEDKQILEDIAKYMNMYEMLKIRKPSYPNEQSKISLIVNSTKICNDLISIGIHPQKTGKERWINLHNDELQWAFLRGMFDADGHIRIYKRNGSIRARFGITGTMELLTEILQFLKSKGLARRVNSIYQKQGCCDLHLANLHDVKALFPLLYAYGELKLNRKFDLFSSLMI